MREPINCTGLELSTYLAVLAEGYLPTFYLDINLSAPSRSMVIASKSYQQGKKTVHFLGFQFSMTLQNLTVSHGEESLMSSRVDSLAKTSHALEKVKESTGIDQASGTKCSVSFAKFDPDTFTLKTAQCSWLEDSMSSYVDLPTAGTMSSGQLFQQVPLAHDINATGFGFLPDGETFFHTPNTSRLDGGSNSRKALKKRQMWLTPTATAISERSEESMTNRINYRKSIGRKSVPPGCLAEQVMFSDEEICVDMANQVSNLDNWNIFPTPKATDGDKGTRTLDGAIKEFERGKNVDLGMVVKMWPTPRAANPGSRVNGNGGKILSEEVLIAEGIRDRGEYVAKFPTPVASMHKGSSENALKRKDGKDRTNDRLDHFVGDTAAARLNPEWVESYLMLWPRAWTALEPLPEGAFYSMQPHDEPEDLPRVTSNCPNRAARLRAIGNGQVPMCAATAFKQLKERLHDEN